MNSQRKRKLHKLCENKKATQQAFKDKCSLLSADTEALKMVKKGYKIYM